MTNDPQTFTVGQGGLGLANEAPSKAKKTCRRTGSRTDEYLPTKKGEHEINVEFADQHISGENIALKSEVLEKIVLASYYCITYLTLLS